MRSGSSSFVRQDALWTICRLELMSSHDTLFLLRNVPVASWLVYLLRTVACCDGPELPLYYAVLRDSLSATLNVAIDDNRWL